MEIKFRADDLRPRALSVLASVCWAQMLSQGQVTDRPGCGWHCPGTIFASQRLGWAFVTSVAMAAPIPEPLCSGLTQTHNDGIVVMMGLVGQLSKCEHRDRKAGRGHANWQEASTLS